MSKLILPENHYFLSASNDISEVCKPLFEQYNCNVFVYGRFYSNGEFILLSNQRDWLHHHLSHGYPTPAPAPLKLLKQQESYHFISGDGPFHQAKHDLINLFNTDQAIDFLIKGEDYYETACFSFPSENKESYSTVFNNLSHFKHFIKMINQEKQLLQMAEQNKIFLPESMQGINFDLVKIQEPENFLPISNLTCELSLKYKNFSSRQIEVLSRLIQGKTAKEIGYELNLSYRTIEDYIRNIKTKMKVASKSQLINKVIGDIF